MYKKLNITFTVAINFLFFFHGNFSYKKIYFGFYQHINKLEILILEEFLNNKVVTCLTKKTAHIKMIDRKYGIILIKFFDFFLGEAKL